MRVCMTMISTPQVVNGHTASNTPDPIRTRKLSGARPGQYWGGGPPGKPFGCRKPFYVYLSLEKSCHLGVGFVPGIQKIESGVPKTRH